MAGADGASGAQASLDFSLLQTACAEALMAQPASLSTTPSTLFVGLSGGLDSVVLLTLALAWQQDLAASLQRRLRVVALHAHHGLQPSADAWLEACRQRCAEFGIELMSAHLELSQDTEGAARAARYDFFRRQLQRPDQCLLLAHHQDDQAETLLLRVAQGRSTQGMPRFRTLGAGMLVRPLLGQPRAALRAYAQAHQLAWVEDPTNALLVADRNFVRHQWLPPAQARWPDLVPKLARLAERQRQQTELLQALVAGWQQVPVQQALMPTGPSLLRVWLQGRGETQVSHQALAEFCAQLGAGPDRGPSLRLAAGELRRYADAVHYLGERVLAGPELADEYGLPCPDVLRLPHGLLKVEGPSVQLSVRFAQSSTARRLGPPVRSRRWQQAGVPPWSRGSYPQLYLGSRRLGLPVAGVATRLPRRALDGVPSQQWSVLWEPNTP